MVQPVLFLAFANDDDDHLALLDQERRVITRHLLPLENAQYIQLISEPGASISDIAQYLSQVKDRLAIFHYAGHADSKQIMLEGQAANSEGLADMLSLLKNLKLVFLNGCSTRAQVQYLLDKGIPAVIATSVPIGDQAAKDFADVFYQNLATEDGTIKSAFDMAAASHKMAKNTQLEIFRGLQIEESTDELPWGLYTKEEKVLDWKIPRRQSGSFILKEAGLRYQSGQVMNQKIVITIANAISDYNRTIGDIMEAARKRKVEPRMRELRAAIIDAFPTPIGVHLRKLLQSDKVSTERLSRIVNLYAVLIEFLAFIALGQIWDEKHHNKAIKLDDQAQQAIKNFLSVSKESHQSFNYFSLLKSLQQVFKANDITPFVAEFSELEAAFEENTDFYRAHLVLEEMRTQLEGTIAAEEIESFCVQAEDHLCAIFEEIGFAAKYTMATIKTIELHKVRHNSPEYRHNLVILNRLMQSIGVLDDVLPSEKYAENNAVVLLSDEYSVHPYLNLSPFIIDENALSGQFNSKLFFYKYVEGGQLIYELIENRKDLLPVTEQDYAEIKAQYDDFKRQILLDQ